MHNDPQQEIFTRLKLDLEAKGFDVYDEGLPPDGTPYPFIYLGDTRQSDITNKNAVFGNVSVMIHVWHNNHRQRGRVSTMMLEIKNVCRAIEHTDNFAWFVRYASNRIISDVITDKTTTHPLLHGVVEVDFRFS